MQESFNLTGLLLLLLINEFNQNAQKIEVFNTEIWNTKYFYSRECFPLSLKSLFNITIYFISELPYTKACNATSINKRRNCPKITLWWGGGYNFYRVCVFMPLYKSKIDKNFLHPLYNIFQRSAEKNNQLNLVRRIIQKNEHNKIHNF